MAILGEPALDSPWIVRQTQSLLGVEQDPAHLAVNLRCRVSEPFEPESDQQLLSTKVRPVLRSIAVYRAVVLAEASCRSEPQIGTCDDRPGGVA